MSVIQVPADAIAALERGHLIEAVKLTREYNGTGLKESKDAIDAYIKTNPRLKRRLISERSSGGGNRAIAFIGLILIIGILYLVASRASAMPLGCEYTPQDKIQFILC